MNRWKLAFWICLSLFVLVTGFSLYSIIDQAVTFTYQKEAFAATESDLDHLLEIINKTNLTRPEINKELKDHRLYEFMDLNSDTISLYRVLLIFENERLMKVAKQW